MTINRWYVAILAVSAASVPLRVWWSNPERVERRRLRAEGWPVVTYKDEGQ